MKFRFINSNEPVTTFYRDLVPFFIKQGHQVEILTSQAEYRADRNLDEAIGGLEGVKIRKTFSFFIKEFNKSFFAKAVVRASYAVHGFLILLLSPKVEMNIYLTQPPFFHIVGLLIKKIRSQPYCCVVMDVQPEQYVRFGILKEGSIITKFLHKVSSLGYKNANNVIVIGRCMANKLADMGVDESKIIFIPNWTSEKIFLPVERTKNSLRSAQKWEDKFVITYGGNIGFAQFFDDFVGAAELLKEKENILFVLIGGGTRAETYKKRVNELKLTNFEFLPFLHENYSLSEIYGAGDVNFISLRDSCTGLGVPSKAYNSLAAGRPIIYQGALHGEIARMILENEIGQVVSNAEELSKAVLDYSKDEPRRANEGQKARMLSETVYSTQVAVESYLNTVSKMTE